MWTQMQMTEMEENIKKKSLYLGLHKTANIRHGKPEIN